MVVIAKASCSFYRNSFQTHSPEKRINYNLSMNFWVWLEDLRPVGIWGHLQGQNILYSHATYSVRWWWTIKTHIFYINLYKLFYGYGLYLKSYYLRAVYSRSSSFEYLMNQSLWSYTRVEFANRNWTLNVPAINRTNIAKQTLLSLRLHSTRRKQPWIHNYSDSRMVSQPKCMLRFYSLDGSTALD